ncbi:hypothetical protein Bbelb_118150 [Branchiostoma belcheri]|nr:hypothetical protein Bbelb_118150 [Branchiostoma belcheri]
MGKKHPKRPGKYIKEQRLLLHVTSSSTGRPKKVHFTVGPRRGGSKGNNTGLTETAAVPNPHVDLQHDEQPPQEDPQPAPSRYSLHKQREINAWKDVREPIFRTSLKLSGPLSNTCSICRKEHTEDMSLYRWRLRFVHINFCKCEPELVSLVRYGLWGASENPQTAFAVSLLEWLVILGNECHVSVNSLYRSLVGEPISEFRQFFYRKSTLTDLSPSLDDGTICPACPKQNGEQTILLDGNFGLVRKASSGTSIVPPHHGSRLFLEDEVDCNHFQAGSKIRSTNRQEKLDVSGMFGSSCRHEMPIRFVNMSRGESLGYPVLLIQQLVQQAQLKNIRLRVVYDIGCVLEAHLKRTKQQDLLDQVNLAIPIFLVRAQNTLSVFCQTCAGCNIGCRLALAFRPGSYRVPGGVKGRSWQVPGWYACGWYVGFGPPWLMRRPILFPVAIDWVLGKQQEKRAGGKTTLRHSGKHQRSPTPVTNIVRLQTALGSASGPSINMLIGTHAPLRSVTIDETQIESGGELHLPWELHHQQRTDGQ